MNEDLRKSSGANFDLILEFQIAHKIGLNQQRIDCDSNDNNNNDAILLVCVLNIVPNSVDENVNNNQCVCVIAVFHFYQIYLGQADGRTDSIDFVERVQSKQRGSRTKN